MAPDSPVQKDSVHGIEDGFNATARICGQLTQAILDPMIGLMCAQESRTSHFRDVRGWQLQQVMWLGGPCDTSAMSHAVSEFYVRISARRNAGHART